MHSSPPSPLRFLLSNRSGVICTAYHVKRNPAMLDCQLGEGFA